MARAHDHTGDPAGKAADDDEREKAHAGGAENTEWLVHADLRNEASFDWVNLNNQLCEYQLLDFELCRWAMWNGP